MNDKILKAELKKCPFCGGGAYLRQYYYGYVADGARPYYGCRCLKCGVSGREFVGESPYVDGHEQLDDMARRKAIEAWNTRVPEEQEGKDAN